MPTPIESDEIDSVAAVIDEIKAERIRQLGKGYTRAHDAQHSQGELLVVIASLLAGVLIPLAPAWAGPILERHKYDRRRRMIIAAAFLVAAIQQLDARPAEA